VSERLLVTFEGECPLRCWKLGLVVVDLHFVVLVLLSVAR
jgi:hypothetical protein